MAHKVSEITDTSKQNEWVWRDKIIVIARAKYGCDIGCFFQEAFVSEDRPITSHNITVIRTPGAFVKSRIPRMKKYVTDQIKTKMAEFKWFGTPNCPYQRIAVSKMRNAFWATCPMSNTYRWTSRLVSALFEALIPTAISRWILDSKRSEENPLPFRISRTRKSSRRLRRSRITSMQPSSLIHVAKIVLLKLLHQ